MQRITFTVTFVLFLVLAPAHLTRPPGAVAAEDDDVKWTSLMSASGGEGGFKHFTLPHNAKVKYTWKVELENNNANFRVMLLKLHERNGSYQILGKIVQSPIDSESFSTGKLPKGKYRLYIATKNAKWHFGVYYEKEASEEKDKK